MAVYADRVKETTTTTGTGTYTTLGAVAGYQTFVVGAGAFEVVNYTCENGTDFEIGTGTVGSGTLTRTTILDSSNAGAAVNWGAGVKNIFLTAPADRTVFTDRTNTFTSAQAFAAGSLSAPSISFAGDSDTGLYLSGENAFAFVNGGKRALTFTGMGSQYLKVANESGYTDLEVFATSGNASMELTAYGTSEDPKITLSTNASGTRRPMLSVGPAATVTGAQNYLQITTGNTGVAPTIRTLGVDANAGLKLMSKGAGNVELGTGTTTQLTVGLDGIVTVASELISPKVTVGAGSVSAPSISFNGDSDTGIYRPGANAIALNAGSGNSTPPLLVTGQDSGSVGIEVAGFSGGFPDLLAIGTATNINIGMFSKGTGYVVLGDSRGSGLFYLQREGTPIGYFDLYAAASSMRIGAYNNSNSSASTLEIFTSGSSTSSIIKLGTYNGSSYRTLFSIRPAATLTASVPNTVAVLAGNVGVAATITAEGGDGDINLDVIAKGTGSIRLNGTATTVSSTGAISTTQIFTHSGSTAHTVSTTGAVTFTGAVVQSTKGFAAAEFSAGSGAPGTITWSNGQNQVRTLTSSGIMTFASPTAGATYKLRIVQGGSGSYTITWPTIKWAGGVAPTLSTAVGAEDIITLYYNGTSYYGQAATGFA